VTASADDADFFVRGMNPCLHGVIRFLSSRKPEFLV
jgi:hypothetical protein